MLRGDRASRIRLVGLLVFILTACWCLAAARLIFSSKAIEIAAAQKPKAKARPAGREKLRIDYSQFSHATHVTGQKLNCDSCHKFPSKNWKDVRKVDEAFPDVVEYPQHESCLNCHRQQFFARERPAPRICSNCHVKSSPRDSSRFPFPSLAGSFFTSAQGKDFVSDFRVQFPHDKHLDVIAQGVKIDPDAPVVFLRIGFRTALRSTEESQPKSCVVCHQTYQPQEKSDDEFVTKPPKDIGDGFWLKKGTFKTRPQTHAACFTCHSQESELAPLPQNCNDCHKLANSPPAPADFDPKLIAALGGSDWWTGTAWRNRLSAGAFRHETHADQTCTNCHNVTTMKTADPVTLKVPVKSCGGSEGCHVTATTEDGGILNYEIDQRRAKQEFVCSKCHLVYGKEEVPSSHITLIPDGSKK